MKYILVVMVTLALGVTGFTQNKIDIVGKWKVVRVQMAAAKLSKEERARFQSVKQSFLKSKFDFAADQHFSFDFALKVMQIKKAHWKFSNNSKSYLIQNWKDRLSNESILMEVMVQERDDKIYFLVSETPFILQVEKEL